MSEQIKPKSFWVMISLIASLVFWAAASAISSPAQSLDGWEKLVSPTSPGGKLLDFTVSETNPQLLYAWFEGEFGSRLYKSQDSALSWQQVYTSTFPVRTIAISPDDPQILYAGGDTRQYASAGFYKSSDAGLSWTEVYTLSQVSLVVSSTLVFSGGVLDQPETTGCEYHEAIISRSIDGGISWQTIPLGCPFQLFAMAAEPGNPEHVYLGGINSKNGRPTFWSSMNGGVDWHETWPEDGSGYGNIINLAIDPSSPERIYASTSAGIYSSPDRGESWQHIDQIYSEPWLIAAGGGKLYAMTLYDSASYRIYRSDDNGQTWWESLVALPDKVISLHVSRGNSNVVFAGLNYYGLWRSDTQGSNWNERNYGIRSPAAIADLALDPENQDHLFAASSIGRGGLYESLDGGLSWTAVLSNTQLSSVVVHPFETIGVFAGGLDGLYQYQNGRIYKRFYRDMTWQVTLSHHKPPWVLVSGFSSNYFIARYRPDTNSPYWTWAISNFENGTAMFTITSDPFSHDIFFSGGSTKSGNIWKSLNGGDSWEIQPATIGNNVELLVADLYRPGWLYAATQIGPYFSQDGGVSWKQRIKGLPHDDRLLRKFAQDEWGNLFGLSVYHGVYRWLPTAEIWEFMGQPESVVLSLTYRPNPSPALLVGGKYNLWRCDLPQIQRYWFPIVAK